MVKGTITSLVISTFIFTHPIHSKADIIASWNFDSSPPDLSPITGTLTPDTGAGSAMAVGGTRTLFQPGSASAANHDDSSWGLYDFPAQDTANTSAGAEFRVSTVGYQNLNIQFQARANPNASRYARLQSSTDGVLFRNLGRLDFDSTNDFLHIRYAVSPMDDAENNPDFAIRIVTEFERTILVPGSRGYVASSTNSYSPTGLIRFDEIIISGDPINPANTPPTISGLADLSMLENRLIEPFPVTLEDAETPAENLRLIVTSSNTQLLPPEGIRVDGTGAQRNVFITPITDTVGSTLIRATVLDPQGRYSSTRFVFTVQSRNTAPTISPIPPQQVPMNGVSAAIPFTVGDQESPSALFLSSEASNPRLIRSITLQGTGAERSAVVVPEPGQFGNTVITLRVTDGRDSSISRFPLVVTGSPDLLLYEPFEYPDGDLVSSSLAWEAHSSGSDSIELASGKVRLATNRSQDANLALVNGPYSGGALYAGLTVTFSDLPSLAGSYFAHFNSGSFRGRIFAHNANATPGFFRLGVSNGAGTRSEWLADLSLDTPYRVVMRFDTEEGQSALWVDPADETDLHIEAIDSPTPTDVTAFALRQSTGIGKLTVDELKVGKTFAAAVGEAQATLAIDLDPDSQLRLSWPTAKARYQLESSSGIDSREWLTVSEPPTVEEGHWVIRLPNTDEPRLFRLVRL